jgi:hypothetical protein
MTEMVETAIEVHREVVEVLLEKIEEDRFPSVTMMDIVEQILIAEEKARYVEILMDKIRADQYPSIDLVRRVSALA